MRYRRRYRRYHRWSRIRRRLFQLASAPTIREGLTDVEVRLALWPHGNGVLSVAGDKVRIDHNNAPAQLTTARGTTTTEWRP